MPDVEAQKVQIKTILKQRYFPMILQNPEYTGHPIRFELDTESGSNWTLNPFLTGQ